MCPQLRGKGRMGALASYRTSLRHIYVEKAGHLATTRLHVACPS